MGSKEKFGKLVLLEEIETTGMGTEYRAAKLGPAGLEKIVTVLRLQPAICTHAEVSRALMDQAKLAAQLQNPNVLKIFGIGKVDQSYYITYEHLEGRSLAAILRRCRQEAFPFSVEHALLVVSKVCSVLEYAQGRRNEGGARSFHGLLTPACILVSYEGEVRVKGFGYWPSRVVETGALGPDDRRYLAPEQAAGNGDYRSDIYSVGAILLETLTGRPPEPGADLLAQVPAARLASPAGDDDSLPPSLVEVFRRSLDRDPAARYPEAAEMRKSIDTLLFSGDFTPTTFNLAFFMHSLYREDIEKEGRALKQEREASYLEYLGEEAPHTPAPAPPPRPAPTAATAARGDPIEARPAGRAETPPAAEVASPLPPVPAPHDSSPGLGARAAATSFTFHKKARSPSRLPLLIGAVAALAAGGGAAWYFLGRPSPPPPPVQAAPPTPSAEALAAQARVKELEEKLAALEAEKAAAEVKAAEEAKKRVEAQAKARGQVVDPAALQKAQEEARRRAKEEQERKQQEELRRIEEERKAEEARLAEERRRAEEQARAAQLAAAAAAAPPSAPAPEAVATPTPVAETPPPTPAPVVLRPGTLVNINDPGVIPPVLERAPTLVYPPIALRQRIEGVVELNVLVDERGTVRDAQVVSRVESKAGLNEAAVDNVKRRRYRPAAKEGVPVKVWVSVRVVFELPK